MQIIDPWSSVEIKDYEKLMTNFGIEPMNQIIRKLPKVNHYFTRGVIFGHKSLQTVIDAINKNKSFAMLTGLMPSGKFHFGHKLVVDEMLYFQELGAQCFVVVADIEANLTRGITKEEARKIAIEEYLLNYIALGLKPKNTKFYFQSNGSKEYMNLSKYISKRTTLNELKDIYGDINPGKIVSIFTQVADILYPQLKENSGIKPVVVPVGIDQLPHINFARDIADRLKLEHNFILPSAIFHKLMPGLKGNKMASSDPDNAIFLSDDVKDVERKIKKYAFSGGQATIEDHKKLGGNPDIDIAYQWLYMMFEPDEQKIKKIYQDYKSGYLLTSELKQILIDKVSNFLREHQKAREKSRKMLDRYWLEDK